MKVKVGSQWFEVQPGEPIMVVLSDIDKWNIANMHPDATKYAAFHDIDTNKPDFKAKAEAWMQDPCPLKRN